MQHGPYVAEVELDEEEGAFHGRVVNLQRDGFDFWGRTAGELREEFARSAAAYEETCREEGKEPERPFSGKFLVRGTPQLHRAVSFATARARKSVNTWVTETLERAAAR